MRIIKPNVKLINFEDRIQQIGYAASICYASNKKGTIERLEQLWKNGHKSVFRHGTRYYIIPSYYYNQSIIDSWRFSPYCGFYQDSSTQLVFLSINEQYYIERPYMTDFAACEVNELAFISEAKKLDDVSFKNVLNLVRIAFEITTQISTSRELNRVSPNNICEQSTRYCNFSNDKFGNEITICQPYWFDILQEKEEININFENLSTNNIEIIKEEYVCAGFIVQYLLSCLEAEKYYIKATREGRIKAEDARGILPLDTATKCIYTYRIEEWNHIFDLRYFGKTGKPHSNAKIIGEKIYNRINEFMNI